MKSAKKKSTVRKAKAPRPHAVSSSEVAVVDAQANEAIVAEIGQPEAIAQEDGASAASTIKLPVSCTLREASELKTLLLKSDSATTLILDAASVERVDTAGLQVITAFMRSRSVHGAGCEWRGLNQTVVQAAELLGLSRQLGIPAAAAS